VIAFTGCFHSWMLVRMDLPHRNKKARVRLFWRSLAHLVIEEEV